MRDNLRIATMRVATCVLGLKLFCSSGPRYLVLFGTNHTPTVLCQCLDTMKASRLELTWQYHGDGNRTQQ